MFKKILIVAVSAISFAVAANPESQQSVVMNSYQEALAYCQKGAPFTFFKAGLTPEEIELLQSIHVKKDGNYVRYGELDSLAGELASFFASIGNDEGDAQKAAAVVANYVNNVVNASGQEAVQVVLRASEPSPAHKIPRWHVDGNYYHPHKENFPKCVLALKGASSLFFPATLAEEVELIKRLRAAGASQFGEKVRSDIASMFDADKALRPACAEGAVFNVGLDEKNGVHSEPDIQEERLFLALVLGNREQIMELKEANEKSEKSSTRLSVKKVEMPKIPDFSIILNPEILLKIDCSNFESMSDLQGLGLESLVQFCAALDAKTSASAQVVFDGPDGSETLGLDVIFSDSKADAVVYSQSNKVMEQLFVLMKILPMFW